MAIVLRIPGLSPTVVFSPGAVGDANSSAPLGNFGGLGLHPLSAILALAEELQQGTLERVFAKSDLELGIEALLRMTNGR